MGSFFGIIEKSAESIDKVIISKSLEAMAYLSPDASKKWIHRNVAFGHHHLNTSRRSELESFHILMKNQVAVLQLIVGLITEKN